MREKYITNYDSENILEGKSAYPYKLSDSETGYGQHLAWRKEWEEEYKKQQEIKRKEAEQQRKIEKKLAEEKTEEFISTFKKHNLSDEMLNKLKLIAPEDRLRMDPVYILNSDLKIVDVVESKNDLKSWVVEQGLRRKKLGRTTIFEYIRNKSLFDGKYYFVPAEKYEQFIKNF